MHMPQELCGAVSHLYTRDVVDDIPPAITTSKGQLRVLQYLMHHFGAYDFQPSIVRVTSHTPTRHIIEMQVPPVVAS